MSTQISGLFSINGVISSDKSVLQNMNTLCTAAGAWMTYDIAEGKWAVVINAAGTSVASFNDSNIIGSINVSGTGISELYNAVSLEYPHKDLRDQTDYVDYEIPVANQFPNELPNTLNIRLDCINNPVQAQYIAASELKQSRVDKVIQFRTDYSKIGLKAGDLIDVTSSVYGYSGKMFRITKIEEDDADDVLAISITALEYDADVYSTAGLTHNLREKKTGIVPKAANSAITRSDNQNTGNQLIGFFNDPSAALLIANLLAALARNIGGGGGKMVALETFVVSQDVSSVQTSLRTQQGTPSFPDDGAPDGNPLAVISLPFVLNEPVSSLVLYIQVPLARMKIGTSQGVRTNFLAYVPCMFTTQYTTDLITFTKLQDNTADWQTPNVIITIPNAPPGGYIISIKPLPTYDLDQTTTMIAQPYDYEVQPQASGGGWTLTGFKYYK